MSASIVFLIPSLADSTRATIRPLQGARAGPPLLPPPHPPPLPTPTLPPQDFRTANNHRHPLYSESWFPGQQRALLRVALHVSIIPRLFRPALPLFLALGKPPRKAAQPNFRETPSVANVSDMDRRRNTERVCGQHDRTIRLQDTARPDIDLIDRLQELVP